jgi:hypothetical protein
MKYLRFSIGWAVVAISVFLGACSAVKIAYNNSDFLLLRYTDSYLDLSSKQKKYLRLSLNERLQEHRREELSHIVALLESMKRAAADGLSAQDIDKLMARIEPIFETTLAKTIPVFTPVLTDISDDQIVHLAKKIAKKNQEDKEDYLQEDTTERFEVRAERITERIERWTGHLSKDQRRLIVSVMELWPDIAQDWYDYRLIRQRELLEMLKKRIPAEQIEPFLIAWWVEQAGQPPNMKNKMKQLHEGMRTLLLALDASLSEQQRAHLFARIDDISSELATLTVPPIQLSVRMWLRAKWLFNEVFS